MIISFPTFICKNYSTEVSEELYNVLNRKHFCEGGILNDESLLLSAIDEIGLDRQKCKKFLDSEDGIQEIYNMVDMVHRFGINGIPVLIINGGQAVINGAAHADEIATHLREVT